MSSESATARRVDEPSPGAAAYSAEEAHALRLAGRLRDNVARERETVRRLQRFLLDSAGGRSRTP